MTTIISGFPGVGKSYYKSVYGDDTVYDSDSSRFSWIEPGKRNPDFPDNYIQHIKSLVGKATIIFVSSHREVRETLAAEGFDFVLVYPKRESKSSYLKRYTSRGSEDSFVKLLDDKWDEFIDEMEAQQNCTKIELRKGEYLSDHVRKYRGFRVACK